MRYFSFLFEIYEKVLQVPYHTGIQYINADVQRAVYTELRNLKTKP